MLFITGDRSITTPITTDAQAFAYTMLTPQERLEQLNKDILSAEQAAFGYTQKANQLKAEKVKIEGEFSNQQLIDAIQKAQAQLDEKKKELGL